jgi:hypothetical protein
MTKMIGWIYVNMLNEFRIYPQQLYWQDEHFFIWWHKHLIFQQKKIIQISQKLFRNNICVLIITNIKFCTLKHVILKLSKSLCQKIKKFQSAKLMKESTMQAYLKKKVTFFCLESVHLTRVLYKNFILIQHGQRNAS